MCVCAREEEKKKKGRFCKGCERSKEFLNSATDASWPFPKVPSYLKRLRKTRVITIVPDYPIVYSQQSLSRSVITRIKQTQRQQLRATILAVGD